MEINKSKFEEKIKPVLGYVGLIGAIIMAIAYIIMAIAYIIIVFVLIQGFKVEELLQTTVFACVNAAVGFIIMQFLKVQGVSFAKMLPENQEIIKKYYKTKTKDKKLRSINYFWVTTVVKDVIIKCATLGITTIGIVYIVIKGSNDYNLLLLAVVNLLMFICFGFISLVNAYDFFNNRHVPYMIEMVKNEEEKQGTGELQPETTRMEEQDQARAEQI